MINFFRRIRKKLADDNKPLKYARYAIGEIVLVVIGILIALQVNTWNENRLNRKREKQLLYALVSNLNQNIAVFERNIKAQLDRVRRTDIILDHLEGKKAFNDSLSYHFRTLVYLEQISPNASAYEALNSIGLDLIQAEELKTKIIELFGYDYPNVSNLVRDVAIQRYGEKAALFNRYFRVNLERDKTVPLDYHKLQQDQEFVNWMYDNRAWKLGVISENEKLIEFSNALLEGINDYLDN